MRQWIAGFLILMLIFTAPLPVGQATTNDWNEMVGFPSPTTMYAPDESGAWLVAGESVHRWTAASGEIVEILSTQGVQHIASDSGVLVAQTSTAIYRIDEAGSTTPIAELDPNAGVILQIETRAGDVLVLRTPGTVAGASGEDGHDHHELEAAYHAQTAELTLIDGETGRETQTMELPYGALSMTVDGRGIVYALVEDELYQPLLLTIDIAKGAITGRLSLKRFLDANYVVASSAGDRLYFPSEGTLYAIDPQTRIIRTTGISMPWSASGIRRGGELLYIGLYGDNPALWACPMPEMIPAARQLRIYNLENALSNALEKTLREFENRNPDLELVLESRNAEGIITSLMAGENDIDILYFSSLGGPDTPRIEDMARAGVLLDLNTIPDLQASFAEWTPMPRLTHFAGQWIAVPVSVMPQAWMVNEELAEELAIHIPEGPWDWERFLEIARELDQKSNGDAYALLDVAPVSVMETFIRDNCLDFENGTASFQSEDARRAITIWGECVKNGYIQKSYDTLDMESGYEGTPYPTNALFIAVDQYMNRPGNKRVCLPPSLGAMDGIPSIVSSIAVCTNGKNQAEAIDFMRLFASDEMQCSRVYVESNVFYMDMNKYLPIFESPIAAAFDDMRQMFEAMTPSPVNHEIWLAILERAMRRQDSINEIDMVNSDAFSAFEKSEIGVEEYVNRVQTIADMVMNE